VHVTDSCMHVPSGPQKLHHFFIAITLSTLNQFLYALIHPTLLVSSGLVLIGCKIIGKLKRAVLVGVWEANPLPPNEMADN